MRHRALMAMGAAVLVLAAAVPLLATDGPAGPAAHRAGAPVQSRPTPSSGACVPATQQCIPSAPHGDTGAAPSTLVVGLPVAVALIALTGARRHRRPPVRALAAGFVTTQLHPPEAGLGTI